MGPQLTGNAASRSRRLRFPAAHSAESQVKEWISGKLVFFGDRCEKGGNDYPLAKVADVVYNVNSWEETRDIIRSFGSSGGRAPA